MEGKKAEGALTLEDRELYSLEEKKDMLPACQSVEAEIPSTDGISFIPAK